MNIWIIEPRDPLIARDGRPFGPNPGARATSISFPFPSTTTGSVRARAGSDAGGSFDISRIQEVKQLTVHGPLLVELDTDNNIQRWLFSAPADAILLETENKTSVLRKPLVPLELPINAMTDLPADLNLVGMQKPVQVKPLGSPPRYWHWAQFKKWLLEPHENLISVEELGHQGPAQERRTHVRVNHEAQAAEEGALFQTQGLEFTSTDSDEQEHRLATAQRLALAVVTDATLDPGLGAMGGERRTVSWRKANGELPVCPSDLIEQICEQRACRLILLTPACFIKGYRPTWLLQPQSGVTPTLSGMVLSRPQVVSGWDLEKNNGRGAPKPTRRLVPAGTVLFLNLDGDKDGDKMAIARWVSHFWLQSCVSDAEQDRRDGFGLAALGTWSGKLAEIEVNDE